MLTKIDLYREVLAIEPNSKVFFPLAKELAGLDHPEEAVDVLKKGVAFHPDHLEAKFLLVELLTRLERSGEAEEAFAGVGEMLAEYPSVWALWAEKAVFAAKDPSLALRFLAHYFKDGSLTWASVLEHGLNNLSTGVAPEPMPAPLSSSVVDMKEGAEHASLDEIALEDYPLGEAATLMHDQPAEEAYLEEPPLDDSGYSLEDELAALEATDSNDSLEPDDAEDQGETEEDGGVILRGADEVRSLAGILDDDVDLETAPDADKTKEQLAAPTDIAGDKSGEGEAETVSMRRSEPETASVQLPDMGVKTMTMAAMLAQQGESKAALAIYEDLLKTVGSDDERLRIEKRIERLRGIPEAADSISTPSKKSKAKSKSKARIAGFLETLAGRLEVRAGV